MSIGFSTGSLALSDVRLGLQIASQPSVDAIELSALRINELDPLLAILDDLQPQLKRFDYISFHAPSKRVDMPESQLINKLQIVAERGWPIIVHPDVIEDFSLWKTLGPAVCIENMDKRKKVGRTASQLVRLFERLPQATFCFDIGHARQIDPTMLEASILLETFSNRLCQVHMSYVNSRCGHERLNHESFLAFRQVAHLIDPSRPIILETPVKADDVQAELEMARKILGRKSADCGPFVTTTP